MAKLAGFVIYCALCIMSFEVKAQVVTSITCATTDDRATVRITCSDKINAFQKPERQGNDLVIRVLDVTQAADATITSCDELNIRTAQIRNFFVTRIKVTNFRGDATIARDGANTVLVTIQRKTEESEESEETKSRNVIPSEARNGEARNGEARNGKWSLDVIVIDAGHGGKDVGAEGVNGVYEKDVTLALARKLRDRIKEQFPSTKVVMTRDSDVFIELFRRTQIANEAKGKLFISIHCNSMPTKPHPANGCETYILRPGRNDDAARVAALENSSVRFEASQDRYKGMTEDQLIVATMAQRSFVRFSEELASRIQKQVSTQTGLANRGVNQAGFFVLVGASMPNILFETAFLSNNKDAAYISSTAGQNATADAMMKAITEYAAFYERSLKH